MFGIIGAMAVEVDALIEKLENKKTAVHSGIIYVQGQLGGTEAVVARCGMGKVNAAICAQTMVLMYKPQAIVNIGVAGAISPTVKIGDIVIAKAAVQHDMDLTAVGVERGFIEEIGTALLPCAANMASRLENATKKACGAGDKYFIGVVATGDQFIHSGEIKTDILQSFNALACEMEGAAIAHVCAVNGVAWGILRTISDNANDDSTFDFNEFVQVAAEKSVKIICEFLTTSDFSTSAPQ